VSWTRYWGLVFVVALGFALFYALVFSLLQGLRENFVRHWQRADLQWTGPGRRTSRRMLRLSWLVLVSFMTAWAAVEWMIGSQQPG